MDRGQIKSGDCIELSIWRECPECKGLGARIIPQGGINIVVVPREICTWCHGFGRQATFIPIDQLANPDSGIDALTLVRAIKDWVDNQPEQTAMKPDLVTCQACRGDGFARGTRPGPCLWCEGSGKVPAGKAGP